MMDPIEQEGSVVSKSTSENPAMQRLHAVAAEIEAKGLHTEALADCVPKGQTRYTDALRKFYARQRELTNIGVFQELHRRDAWQTLLTDLAGEHGYIFLAEQKQKRGSYPDGCVLTQPKAGPKRPIGWWEAGTPGKLQEKYKNKSADGYDMENMLIEDSGTEVMLIQNRRVVSKINLFQVPELCELIEGFFSRAGILQAEFSMASQEFCAILPKLAADLKAVISAKQNEKVHLSLMEKTAEAISPHFGGENSIKASDVAEMLVQHMLIRRLFDKLYMADIEYINPVAQALKILREKLINGTTDGNDLWRQLDGYYESLYGVASVMEDHPEWSDQLLKDVYQEFYGAYNVKDKDRLGAVYTPQIIVDFMVRTADKLLAKHFREGIAAPCVSVLDPATGTGTFLTAVMRLISATGDLNRLRDKYTHTESNGGLWANEVSVLASYVASVAIDQTFRTLSLGKGGGVTFAGLCYQDTLALPLLSGSKEQYEMGVVSFSGENADRVRRQRKMPITLVLGNPPWRAKQKNVMEMNANAQYPDLDKKIKSLYQGKGVQKADTKNLYKRFLVWALDRIQEQGVVAFITDRGWLNSRGDGPLRHYLREQCDALYVIDLGGDMISEPNDGNVFAGNKTGAQIIFMVRDGKSERESCRVFYSRPQQGKPRFAKLKYLEGCQSLSDLSWETVSSTGSVSLTSTKMESGFDNLPLPMVNKDCDKVCKEKNLYRTVKSKIGEMPVFKIYSNGISSGRDDWAWDLDAGNLLRKMSYFRDVYEKERERYAIEMVNLEDDLRWDEPAARKDLAVFSNRLIAQWLSKNIKWTRELISKMCRGKELSFDDGKFRKGLWRPFVEKEVFYHRIVIHTIYRMPNIFSISNKRKESNFCICFNMPAKAAGEKGKFTVLMAGQVPDKNLFSAVPPQCVPRYIYTDDGQQISNLTVAGLARFRTHYEDRGITEDDVFYYTYAALQDPSYVDRYQADLLDKLPRLPLHEDFYQWVKWGRELSELHVKFNDHPLLKWDVRGPKTYPKNRDLIAVCLNKTDKKTGERYIHLDSETEIRGIPQQAWAYTLAGRPALCWPLVEHQREGRPGKKEHWSDKVTDDFYHYNYRDHRDKLLKLLGKIGTVAVRTEDLRKEMSESGKQLFPRPPR